MTAKTTAWGVAVAVGVPVAVGSAVGVGGAVALAVAVGAEVSVGCAVGVAGGDVVAISVAGNSPDVGDAAGAPGPQAARMALIMMTIRSAFDVRCAKFMITVRCRAVSWLFFTCFTRPHEYRRRAAPRNVNAPTFRLFTGKELLWSAYE